MSRATAGFSATTAVMEEDEGISRQGSGCRPPTPILRHFTTNGAAGVKPEPPESRGCGGAWREGNPAAGLARASRRRGLFYSNSAFDSRGLQDNLQCCLWSVTRSRNRDSLPAFL